MIRTTSRQVDKTADREREKETCNFHVQVSYYESPRASTFLFYMERERETLSNSPYDGSTPGEREFPLPVPVPVPVLVCEVGTARLKRREEVEEEEEEEEGYSYLNAVNSTCTQQKEREKRRRFPLAFLFFFFFCCFFTIFLFFSYVIVNRREGAMERISPSHCRRKKGRRE